MKAAKPAKRAPKRPPVEIAVEAPEPDDPLPGNDYRWQFIALLVVGGVLLGITSVLALNDSLPAWESRIFSAVNGMHLPDWVASQIARPLSNAVWGMVGLIGLLLLVPKFRLRAWQYAVAAGSTYVTIFLLEHLINRARPAGLTEEVVLRASQGGPGFPSGHVGVLTALCLTVWLFV
jgi:hypothetical protein